MSEGTAMGFDAPTTVSGLARPSLPQSWDAELVGEKIVQAFVTLDQLPKVRTPRGPGSNWPSVMVEWADQLAWEQLTEAEKQERREIANRTKIPPSALEITQMEMAFDWLRALHLKDSGMVLVVTLWALRTAQGRSIKRLCIEKKWAPRTFWNKRRKALQSLARTLNDRGVPMF